MKKFFLPLSIVCLIASVFAFSTVKAGGKSNIKAVNATIVDSVLVDNAAVSSEAKADILYTNLGLEALGLSKQALQYAMKGFDKLNQKGLVSNPDVITVIDFTQSSSNKRMYIIDVANGKLLMNTYVAHGKNSGLQYADNFSNTPESLQSSLGFYVTKNTYVGKHGTSLRLGGLDQGFNDKAEARAVVVHGAAYIGDGRKGAPYMGRSFGCPAVPQEHAAKVIDLIKNGTAMFIYKPVSSYLQNSKVLNG